MARDPLARLARLRAIEERGAKIELARRLAAEAAARAEASEAAAAIPREAAGAAGDSATDFARWLPRALAAQARAAAQARIAAQRVDGAREALAAAHQAREVVDEALAARVALAEADAARKTQALLDDLSARRRAAR